MKNLVTDEFEENMNNIAENIIGNIDQEVSSNQVKPATKKRKRVRELVPEEIDIYEFAMNERKNRRKSAKQQVAEQVNTNEEPSEKIAKEKTSKKKENPFVFSLNLEKNLLEISASEDKYEIYTTNEEYVLFLGEKASYFSSAQNNLSLKTKHSKISIYKIDDVYNISTNLNVEISDNVSITNFEKSKNIISFSTSGSFKLASQSEKLIITGDVYNKNRYLTNLTVPHSSNNCLVISDEDQKVYLPYSFDEVDRRFKTYQHKYESITDLIEKEYVLPLSYFKHPFKARFREGYKLMRRKQHASIGSAIALGLELAFETHLHPAIITACKSLEELDIYLDCLDDNELDKFSCFDIIYKTLPVVLSKKKSELV